MSTNKAKPFGILQTKKEDIEKHFFDLSVKKIFGIGKASAEKLIYNNINTYSDLVNCQNDVFLKSVFGKNYFIFIQNLKGLNITKEHVLPHEVKSISNSETFMVADSNDENYLINELKKIVKNVCERANNSNLEGNEITVSLIQKNKL
ncbi:DNA polymerase IV [Chlamydia trachomatis]|nr:DNA polymerase IV [Chlamydia trachomatis]